MANYHRFFLSGLTAVQAILVTSAAAPEKKNSQPKPGSLIIITNTNSDKLPISQTVALQSIKGQEELLLKRIAEYWKDGDFSIAKAQILDFLTNHPQSPSRETLLSMLGDIFFQEDHFREAAAAYGQIQGDEMRQRVLLNHVQALFEMQEYATISKMTTAYFAKEQGVDPDKNLRLHLIHAEALFRQMLGSQDAAQQQHFAKLAKPHYKLLEKTEFGDLTLFPLAEVYRTLKEHAKAAEQYTALAEKHPEKAEELLFQAASLQVKYDKNAAINTFKKVCSMQGKRSAPAAYDMMVLLFQQKRYRDLVQNKDLLIKTLSKDHQQIGLFFIGRSLLEVKNYKGAAEALESFAAHEDPASTKLKTALLGLAICAENLKDLSLFDRTLNQLIASFPKDPECAKAISKHAQFAFNSGNLSTAESDLKQIIENYPEFGDRENLLFDYALLQFRGKKWSSSRQAFLSFDEQFPSSSKKIQAYKFSLEASLQLVKGQSANENFKLTLIEDAERLLRHSSGLDDEERRDCHFLLAKTLLDVKDTIKARPCVEDYLSRYSDHPSAAEAHLFAAACAQKESDYAAFTSHSENAIAIHPAYGHNSQMRLQLFNAYLELAAHKSGEERNAFHGKAANHLYEVFASKSPLKQNNVLWLANHYYQHGKDQPDALHKASELLEYLLALDEQGHFKNGYFTADTLSFETEAMKLAEIYHWSKQDDKRIALLESLTTEQLAHKEWEWKFQRRALFELAVAYESHADLPKALQTYEQLIQTGSHAASYLSNAAVLQKARLQYSLMPETDKNESNPQLIEILNDLKDLQIKKKLYSEPIHLEAALDYTDIRVKLADPKLKLERQLFFFKRVKEDFQVVLSRDYAAAREVFPEKAELFESYMKYIQTEIQRLEAVVADQNHNRIAAEGLKQQSIKNFEELLKDNNLTAYLRSRIETSLEEIKKL